jgi:hypothetical protein
VPFSLIEYNNKLDWRDNKMNEMFKYEDVESKVLTIRGEYVIIDRDVAELYGVETKRINEAVKNNPDKFPGGYIIALDEAEKSDVVENFDHLAILKFSHAIPSAFTERGLYMLATILKNPVATQTTIAIINAFAGLRELNRYIKQLPYTTDEDEQSSLSTRIGNALFGLFDDDIMEIKGDERSMELNLPFIKLKRTVTLEKRNEKE